MLQQKLLIELVLVHNVFYPIKLSSQKKIHLVENNQLSVR